MESPKNFTSATEKTDPVGTGPYVLDTKDTVVGSTYVFTKNDKYFAPQEQHYSKIVMNVYTTPTAVLNAIKGGQIDGAPLGDNSMIAQVEAAGYTANAQQLNFFGLLLFDRDGSLAPELADVRVRQAINYAFDRDAMLEAIGQGYGDVTSSIFSPESSGYDEAADQYYDYDPEKAKELLAEAGASDLSITLNTTDTGWVKEVAPLIKESLDAVGVKTTLEISQSAAMYEKVDSGDYTVAVAPGDPSVFGVDPDLLMNWWYGDNVWQKTRTGWSDSPEYAELTELLKTAVQQTGDEQQQTWNKAFDLLSEQAVVYPLFHRKLPTAWSSQQLVGFKPVPTTGLSFLDVGVAAK